MAHIKTTDPIQQRIDSMKDRINTMKNNGLYFFNQPISELHEHANVLVNEHEMGMFASYSYLGLIGHPRINEAAKRAIDLYGTGTHGVRGLAGTLTIHQELEQTIANFKNTEAAIVYTSGYVTNVSVISALLNKDDYVISDVLNHASIADGCGMSGAKLIRFAHNDLLALENALKRKPNGVSCLVIADAVFSMDGDIIDLVRYSELCKKYNAWLMIDEAHSIGVLGKTGRGIEEHFDLENVIDIKMGTLSKTIPSVGGYIAGKSDLINYLRHASRAYIFSAALPPAQIAAATEAFRVILEESWRVEKLRKNTQQFIQGLKRSGFNTLSTQTAIVPVICGSEEIAYEMTRYCQERGVFALPVIYLAVPKGLERLRLTVTSEHEFDQIESAINIIEQAGKIFGVIS